LVSILWLFGWGVSAVYFEVGDGRHEEELVVHLIAAIAPLLIGWGVWWIRQAEPKSTRTYSPSKTSSPSSGQLLAQAKRELKSGRLHAESWEEAKEASRNSDRSAVDLYPYVRMQSLAGLPRNKREVDTNLYKNSPHGFSWTFFIFGWWVPAMRGGEKLAALLTFLFGFPIFAFLHVGPAFARTMMVAVNYELGWLILLVGIAAHIFVSFHYNEWSYQRKKLTLHGGAQIDRRREQAVSKESWKPSWKTKSIFVATLVVAIISVILLTREFWDKSVKREDYFSPTGQQKPSPVGPSQLEVTVDRDNYESEITADLAEEASEMMTGDVKKTLADSINNNPLVLSEACKRHVANCSEGEMLALVGLTVETVRKTIPITNTKLQSSGMELSSVEQDGMAIVYNYRYLPPNEFDDSAKYILEKAIVDGTCGTPQMRYGLNGNIVYRWNYLNSDHSKAYTIEVTKESCS
jgi:hypothetical protein